MTLVNDLAGLGRNGTVPRGRTHILITARCRERRYDLFVQDEAVVDYRVVSQMLLHNSESRRDELANVDVETHMQDTTAINKATTIFSHLATIYEITD